VPKAPPDPDNDLMEGAVRFSSYALLSTICAPYLAPDADVVERGLLRTSFADPDDPRLTAATDMLADRFRKDGALLACLDVESFLRDSGLPTGIDGPSFRCSPDAVATEVALCAAPDLWPRDRAMNALYFHVRGLTDARLRKRKLAEQRAWLASRNACGADTGCLRQRYDERLWEFRSVRLH
jgi:hypothetical protein